MKDLIQFLTESLVVESFNIGADFITPDSCIAFIKEKTFKGKDKDIPTEFINLLYKIWNEEKSADVKFIPLRFDASGHIKLSNTYNTPQIISQIKDCCKDNGYKLTLTAKAIKVGLISATWGEGSLFSNRAEKGLNYEETVLNEIIEVIQLCSNPNFNPKDLNSDLIRYTPMLDTLKPLIEGVRDGKLTVDDLKDKVKLTGKQDVSRNKHGEIWDENFNITDSDMKDVLFKSGKIISDVTVDDDIYVSVKMKAAQLSGVTYRNAMLNNQRFQEGIKNGTAWDKLKNDKEMIAFVNVFDTFGLEPEDVYNKYKELIEKGSISNNDLKIVDNDPDKLGILVQKLIGGNYFYLNPKYCFYIPYDVKYPQIKISEATVSPEGKTITLKGKLKNINFKLHYRTDGGGPFPYRIFPQLDVKEYIESI